MRNLIFYKELKNKKIDVVLVFAKYDNKWVLCKHKTRDTLEVCGGHVEKDESIYQAAERELYEESGAIAKNIQLVGYLSKNVNNSRQYAAVFVVEVDKIEQLPNYEMSEIILLKEFPLNTTYPETYSKLLKIVGSRL